MYTRFQDECYKDDADYEKRPWWARNFHNFNVIKDDRYWAEKIVKKSERVCMCITIHAGSKKCVELLIIDNIWTEYCDRDKIPFLDMCDDRCYKCEKCIFALEYNDKLVEDYFNLRINRHCNACEQVTCKCFVEECDVI
ncbi:hypothetical protein ALC60_02023 [Trachymyrmex zeteki]|uniref:Uncharacterized protein n=1 Tax=Mycetomoellerius zeteki TaxID=64791 RepID=A0A151XF02_9HYME|nr:hypothetical protein ALC60_02023 [Trachymyrmex zeteki]